MENYQVELKFTAKFFMNNFFLHLYVDAETFTNYIKDHHYSDIFDSKVIITYNWKLTQFDNDNFLPKEYWNNYQKVLKNRLPDAYLRFQPSNYNKECEWIVEEINDIYINNRKNRGNLLICLYKIKLLRRSPKVIFKKVFANIVLKSLLDDIYKPGSKLVKKWERRFLENSKQLLVVAHSFMNHSLIRLSLLDSRCSFVHV